MSCTVALFKHLYDFGEIYTCIKYLLISICVLYSEIYSIFDQYNYNVILVYIIIAESHYMSKCFIEYT